MPPVPLELDWYRGHSCPLKLKNGQDLPEIAKHKDLTGKIIGRRLKFIEIQGRGFWSQSMKSA